MSLRKLDSPVGGVQSRLEPFGGTLSDVDAQPKRGEKSSYVFGDAELRSPTAPSYTLWAHLG